jgi:hypothetical protein
MPLPYELKQEFLKGNLVIFVGAGFTKAYLPAMPAWSDLLTVVFQSLTGNFHEIFNYASPVFDDAGNRILHPSEYLRLAQQFELEREKVNRQRANQNQQLLPSIHEQIQQVLTDTYDPDAASVAFQNTHFAQAQNLPLPIWITTNYDTFVEDTYLAQGIAAGADIVLSRPARNIDFGAPMGGGRTLLKIHGSVDNPDPQQSIVITEEDYHRFLRQDRYFINKLYTLFCERFVVFLGYSLTDPNIQFIYNEVLFDQKFGLHSDGESFAQIRPSFFVSRTAIPDQQKIYYLHKRIQYIENCTTEQFFVELIQSFQGFEQGRADVVARIRANLAEYLDQAQHIGWDVDPDALGIAVEDRTQFLTRTFDLIEFYELASASPTIAAIPELATTNLALFTLGALKVIRHWGANLLQLGRPDILEAVLNYVQEKLQIRRSSTLQQLLEIADEWLHQFPQLLDLDRFVRRYCHLLFQYDARYNNWDDYTFCLKRFVMATALFRHMANALRSRVIAGLHRQLCTCGRSVGDSWYTTNAVYWVWPHFSALAWPLLQRIASANPNDRHNSAILQHLGPGADYRQFFPR